MRWGWRAALLLAAMVGCTDEQALTPPEASPPVLLPFADDPRFDGRLSDAMARGAPRILVTPAGRLAVDALPPGLERWLAAIDQRGGGITFVDTEQRVISDNRPLLAVAGQVFATVARAWGVLQERRRYAVADDYQAIIYYRQSDRQILRVAFLHK